MDYLKYLKYTYRENENNCWEFVRFVYKNEHNIELPKLPILDTKQKECKMFLKSNIKYKINKIAQKGNLIHVTVCDREHIGYAIDDKSYIHLKGIGVLIQKIPKNAIIYEVLND